jgi:hypothetical protein
MRQATTVPTYQDAASSVDSSDRVVGTNLTQQTYRGGLVTPAADYFNTDNAATISSTMQRLTAALLRETGEQQISECWLPGPVLAFVRFSLIRPR